MKLKYLLTICLISSVGTAFGGDLNKLYANDYKTFWQQRTENKEKTLSCSSPSNTAAFISDAVETMGNAEVTEANAEEIEKLAISKPKCFLEGLQKLSREKQKKIIKSFIINPIFTDKNAIDKSLNSAWNNGEYQVQKQIFNEAKNSR